VSMQTGVRLSRNGIASGEPDFSGSIGQNPLCHDVDLHRVIATCEPHRTQCIRMNSEPETSFTRSALSGTCGQHMVGSTATTCPFYRFARAGVQSGIRVARGVCSTLAGIAETCPKFCRMLFVRACGFDRCFVIAQSVGFDSLGERRCCSLVFCCHF
jgi:hypothetical protein